MTTQASNHWREIARSMEEADLVCPNCHATNGQDALLVRLDDKGVAGCDKCGHVWTIDINQREIR